MWWRYIILLLLHREQLHVSALDNGHLQVVHESLSKKIYKYIYIYIYIYMGYLCGERGGGKVGTRSLPPPPSPYK